MAINPDRPVGQAATTSTATTTPATGASKDPGRGVVKVTDQDFLLVTVKKDDTLFKAARLFADDKNNDGTIAGKELTGFVDKLKKANGGSPAMAINSTLKIPVKDASYRVLLGTAIQKFLDANPDSGKGASSDYDFRGVTFQSGPADSTMVTVPKKGGGSEDFVVSDPGMGEGDEITDEYTVLTKERFMAHWKDTADEELPQPQ